MIWKKNKLLVLYRVRTKSILLKYLKIYLDTSDLKIILLDHRNNYVGNLIMLCNAAKNCDILTISLNEYRISYIIF